MEELWKLDAFEISKLFKKKEVSAVEICQQTISHIQNTNPKINAIVVDTFEEAKKTAILLDEKLAKNADFLGKLFRAEMNKFIKTSSIVNLVRGRGLLNAILINDDEDSDTAWNICLRLRDNGLLAKPTHGNIIRFAPPLVMTEDQLIDCVNIIIRTLSDFEAN